MHGKERDTPKEPGGDEPFVHNFLHQLLKLGTFVARLPYQEVDVAQRLLTNPQAHRPRKQESEDVMDAKYNWIIDNTGMRLALNVVGFVIWLLACAVLLSL